MNKTRIETAQLDFRVEKNRVPCWQFVCKYQADVNDRLACRIWHEIRSDKKIQTQLENIEKVVP